MICYDLFCGLDGWGEAFLAEGFEVIGYDIVDMAKEIGRERMPGLKLVLRDVLTIHGSEFKNATCIVASPPCQAYSYRAMPWKRAKALPPPDNTLFEACFRIQREACEAAGRHIPMVVENVRGAEKWVGAAKWHFGSYYLWGDVPVLMPPILRTAMKLGVTHRSNGETNFHGHKVPGFRFDGSGKSFQSASVEGTKVPGCKISEVGFNVKAAQLYREGVKQQIPGNQGWFGPYKAGCQGSRNFSSKSNSRKAASAQIAKIPYPLASHIARMFKQQDESR